MSAHKTVELLAAEAERNRRHPLRSGQLLHLPAKGDLVVTGDVHNHRRNYERAAAYADLGRHPQRYLILQELIHGGALGSQGEDDSFAVLEEALGLSAQFPGRVLFLLGNHDLAQVQRLAIMKDGYDQTERFNRYFELRFGKGAGAVGVAFAEFVYSQALAAITVTGVLLAHSLPTARDLRPGPKAFDASLLRRALVEADYQRLGPVYQLLWGRRHTAEALGALAKMWWADVFVCGHQPQDQGWGVVAPNLLILDSSHNHGVVLHMDLGRAYTLEDLTRAVVPLAGLR